MPSRAQSLSWTQKIDRVLHDNHSVDKRRFDLFIAFLVLVSTAIIFVGGVAHDDSYKAPAWVSFLDNLILFIFLLEYLARVVFARPNLPKVIKVSRSQWWRYHIQARLSWMMTPMAIIDFLAFLPLFALDRAFGNFKLFRILRILRLLRLYRLVAIYNPLDKLGKAFRNNSLLYFVAFSLVIVTIAMGSIAFYIVEGEANPTVRNPFDAIWWTVVTLTTVGYGDTVPTTHLGRLVAMILMLSGVVLMAIFAGVMTQTLIGYLLDVREERVRMSSTVNHFIICGWNSRGAMVAEELKHLAMGDDIILFADMEEPQDLPEDVTFLRGNPTKESEWDKVRLSMAKNILVLAPSSGGEITADGYTALVVYTIRSYESKLKNKGVERLLPMIISAELLDPENYQHLTVAGADEVVHTAQVGSNLMAHSSVKPGMTKVITELISWWGQGIELEPAPDLEGPLTFRRVADHLRTEKGYLVLGLVKEDGSISLNPADSRPVGRKQDLVIIRDNEDY